MIHHILCDPIYGIIMNKFQIDNNNNINSFMDKNAIHFSSNSYITNKKNIEYIFTEEEIKDIYLRSQIDSNGFNIKNMIDIDSGYFIYNKEKNLIQIRPHFSYVILDKDKNPTSFRNGIEQIKLMVEEDYYLKLEYIDISNTGYLKDINSFLLLDDQNNLELSMNIQKDKLIDNTFMIKIKSQMLGDSLISIRSMPRLIIYPFKVLLKFIQNGENYE